MTLPIEQCSFYVDSFVASTSTSASWLYLRPLLPLCRCAGLGKPRGAQGKEDQRAPAALLGNRAPANIAGASCIIPSPPPLSIYMSSRYRPVCLFLSTIQPPSTLYSSVQAISLFRSFQRPARTMASSTKPSLQGAEDFLTFVNASPTRMFFNILPYKSILMKNQSLPCCPLRQTASR
jgi:hypothetical protein